MIEDLERVERRSRVDVRQPTADEQKLYDQGYNRRKKKDNWLSELFD